MILVFGSLNMDLVMQVPALPKPGETALSPGYLLQPGGKGNNQAIAAARAGAEVIMVGSVGNDPFGARLLDTLKANGVGAAGVRVQSENTGVACICVDPQGHNFITVGSGANMLTVADQVPEASLHIGATTVLMQMEVQPTENWTLIRHAHESGALAMLNVAPASDVPPAVLELLDVLIVNEHEGLPLARALDLPTDEPLAFARAIAEHSRLTCVVTLGEQGAIAASGGQAWTMDAMRVRAIDATGAGDAFTGVLAASLDGDYDLPMALHRATVAAGLTCEALGAQDSLPTKSAIEKSLQRVAPPRPAH